MRKTCSLVLSMWLAAGTLFAAAKPALEIVVSDNEHTAKYRYELDDLKVRELAGSAKKLDEWTLKAKRDHAERFGYSKRSFGKDSWKIIAGLKVSEIQLITARGKRALREGEMPPGSDIDSWYTDGETQSGSGPEPEPEPEAGGEE